MILQDRNDVLATAHEPPSAREVERALVVGVYSISDPGAQEGLIEPYGVAKCSSSLNFECEPGFGAGGRKVCAPEDVTGMISIVTGIENNSCVRMSGVDGGSVVSCGPQRIVISWVDFWERVGSFLRDS